METQCLADQHGNVVVVSTRDCSLQRRHQKLVEEASAPFLSDEQLARLYTSSKAILREAGYVGAGTCEFLVGLDGTISFLEVNTRLQVEHPVSEEVTGLDLVREMFRIAAGEELGYDDPQVRGHSIEFRINAEDPGRGFLPTPGTITVFEPPTGPGVRLDSGVVSGSSIPGVFDSLMAKLVVTGATREEALRRARRALREFRIEGIATVLPFHRAAIETADFIGADGFKVHTRWIETDFAAMPEAEVRPALATDPTLIRTHLEIDGRRVALALPAVLLAGLGTAGQGSAPAGTAKPDENAVVAPVSGTLQAFRVEDGAEVAQGDLVAVMEAMKMETQVFAVRAGRLRRRVKEGEYVNAGDALLIYEP